MKWQDIWEVRKGQNVENGWYEGVLERNDSYSDSIYVAEEQGQLN